MYSSNSLLQSEDSENSTGSCGPVQRNLGSVSGFLDLWYLEKEGLLKTSNIPLPFPLVQYGPATMPARGWRRTTARVPGFSCGPSEAWREGGELGICVG